MELPTKNHDYFSGEHHKTQYKISTEKLSYKLRKSEEKPYNFNREVAPTTYILKNITCEARAGEMSAIAGPSGAGKTTLLEILAGMVPQRHVSGKILVNDQPMNPNKFRRFSGYVTQEEALFPLLTVEETLTYSARLRLHGGPHKVRARVRELLRDLGLEHVASARIGGGERSRGRTISGGEKRRVSIGVDVVHDPAVLLLDEPTSGLDSASALHVALLLKSMAQKGGKTVLLTIHQPGFRILELFDQILLLSNGSLIHNGSLGSLERRIVAAGFVIPRQVNVLEFAIEVTEALALSFDDQEISTSNSSSSSNSEVGDIIELEITQSELSSEVQLLYPNRPLEEVLILSQRFSKNVYRTKQLFAARIVLAVVVGVVLGTVFMGSTHDRDPRRVVIFQTQLGFFAFSLTFLLSATTEGLPIYLQERRILMRESSRGAYRVSSYVISNFLVFAPFLLLVAILYATPVYWLVGLRREFEGFLYFYLVVWLVIVMSNSFVACLSALVPNFISGTTLIGGLMGAFFLFSGYFIAECDMPRYWIFMHYLSLFKYPFECFVINEYGGEHGKRRCMARLGGKCVLFGDKFLAQKGLRESQKWTNLSVMLGFIIGYRLLCFVILWCRAHRSRLC